MRRDPTVLMGAVLAALVLAAPARADYMLAWTAPTTLFPSIEGHMSVELIPQGPLPVDPDGGNFVAANLITHIDLGVLPGMSEHFHATAALLMTVSDNVGNVSQPFTVDIGGYLTKRLTSSSSHITISPVDPPSATLTLNGDHFDVLFFYTPVPPGEPNSTTEGAIGGVLEVQIRQGGTVKDSPEPPTLALSMLGFSCLGVVAWRGSAKRRQRQ